MNTVTPVMLCCTGKDTVLSRCTAAFKIFHIREEIQGCLLFLEQSHRAKTWLCIYFYEQYCSGKTPRKLDQSIRFFPVCGIIILAILRALQNTWTLKYSEKNLKIIFKSSKKQEGSSSHEYTLYAIQKDSWCISLTLMTALWECVCALVCINICGWVCVMTDLS